MYKRQTFFAMGFATALVLSVGCASKATGPQYDGTLDGKALALEAGPDIVALEAIKDTDEKLIVAVTTPKAPQKVNLDTKAFTQQLRAHLAEQSQGDVTFVVHGETARHVRRTASKSTTTVNIDKLMDNISSEILKLEEFKQDEVVLALILPREGRYVNINQEEYVTSLRRKLMNDSNRRVKFLLPGKFDGADYILSNVFTTKDETIDGMRLLDNYVNNKEIEKISGQIADIPVVEASEEVAPTTKRAAAAPRFIRRSAMGSNTPAKSEQPSKKRAPALLATNLELMLLDAKTNIFLLEQKYDLKKATTGVRGAKYLLQATISEETTRTFGKDYHTVTLRLVQPDENDAVIWESEFKTQFIEY